MRELFIWIFVLLLSVSFVSAASVEIVSTDPAPAAAGEYNDITFRVTNTAGAQPIDSLSLGIEQNAYVTQVSPDVTSSRLGSGQSITRTLRVYIDESAPEGSLELVSQLSFDGAVLDTEHDFFIEDSQRNAELVVGEIRTTPSLLLPDTDDNELRVTLQNLGEKDAELVTASLMASRNSLSEASAFSMRDSVASIPAGEQAVLTFTVDIDEDQRSNAASTLDLRYRTKRDSGDQYDVFEESVPLTIPIDDSPYLEVLSTQPLTEFDGGSTDNTLRITIGNTGEEVAEDVRVRLFPDISFPFLFELTSQYIGARIQPGENVSIDVTFEILSDADARTYPVAVELESIVGTTRYAQDDEVPITVVREESSASGQVGFFIIGLVLLVAAGIGVTLWRKRKN